MLYQCPLTCISHVATCTQYVLAIFLCISMHSILGDNPQISYFRSCQQLPFSFCLAIQSLLTLSVNSCFSTHPLKSIQFLLRTIFSCFTLSSSIWSSDSPGGHAGFVSAVLRWRNTWSSLLVNTWVLKSHIHRTHTYASTCTCVSAIERLGLVYSPYSPTWLSLREVCWQNMSLFCPFDTMLHPKIYHKWVGWLSAVLLVMVPGVLDPCRKCWMNYHSSRLHWETTLRARISLVSSLREISNPSTCSCRYCWAH